MRLLLTAILSCATLACSAGDPDPGPGEAAAADPAAGGLGDAAAEDAPAPAGSGEPFLATTPGGDLLLSWVEATSDSTHALRFARRTAAAWSAPRTVAEGGDWFVNWADFPSIVELPDGSLAAHYLRRSGPGTYAYDVWLTRSTDGGATWQPALRPHRDGTQTEHGFVSLYAHGDSLGAVWLDGRAYEGAETSHGGPGGEMSLRFTTWGRDAEPAAETALDARTCDCCQTAVVVSDAGPVVFYRDRSEAEIRDIHVLRQVGGGWTESVPVHADGWRIDACPVNGPAADASGSRIAVAWFTAAQDSPRVHVAFSADAGATFAPPVRVDGGDPVGRVDLVLDADGTAYVSWLENTPTGADIRVRAVSADGRAGRPVVAGSASAARASGFPRLARHDADLWLAWTEPGEASRVRLARVPVLP